MSWMGWTSRTTVEHAREIRAGGVGLQPLENAAAGHGDNLLCLAGKRAQGISLFTRGLDIAYHKAARLYDQFISLTGSTAVRMAGVSEAICFLRLRGSLVMADAERAATCVIGLSGGWLEPVEVIPPMALCSREAKLL